MTTKNFLGYVFIFLAALLTIAIFGQLSTLIGIILDIFKIFIGKSDSSQMGQVFGKIFYWTFHFIATISLYKNGISRIKKESKI